MNKSFFRKIVRFLCEPFVFAVTFPIGRIKYHGHKIYLISERGTEARDNGYHLFKYFREQHPEKECYYVISGNSPDREKVERYGNIVRYRSLQHYLLFAAAEYKISTHIWGCSPNTPFYTRVFHYLPHWGKLISIKHGITKDDLIGLYAENAKLDLLISGAKPEYDIFRTDFHYTDRTVQYTGFARFDNLFDSEVKKQVLIMPTFRRYLVRVSESTIRQSKYVQTWNALLNNAKLISKIKEMGVIILFYPHYEIQPYLDLFHSHSDSVVIADFAHYDVQELLKESAFLITDYSSVYFDFAYMNKPCAYYQFDKDEYFAKHYKKGYFHYDTMGFGPVIENEEDLVDYIIEMLQENFAQPAKYEARINGFFPLRDNHNCERIYDAIERL